MNEASSSSSGATSPLPMSVLNVLAWGEGARLDRATFNVGRSCLNRSSVAYATERAMAFYSGHRDRDRIREELTTYLAAVKLETN